MKQFFEVSEVEKKVKEKKPKKVSANSSKSAIKYESNLFLKNVTFKENFRNLKKGLSIDFKPLTLLVGEQGSGKSSLLKLLSENDRKILKFDLSEVKLGIKTYFFDTEKHNPRVRDMHEYTNMDGSSKGIGLGGKLSSHFQSHGEVLKSMTIDLLNKQNESCVLFMDEPESALSLKNQIKLFESIQNVLNKGCQVIIATHCLTLIQKVDWIYDMEINQWVKSKHFIDNSFGKDSFEPNNPYNIFLNGNDEKIDGLLNLPYYSWKYDGHINDKDCFYKFYNKFVFHFDFLSEKQKLKFLIKEINDNFKFCYLNGKIKDYINDKLKINYKNNSSKEETDIIVKKLTQILNELQ